LWFLFIYLAYTSRYEFHVYIINMALNGSEKMHHNRSSSIVIHYKFRYTMHGAYTTRGVCWDCVISSPGILAFWYEPLPATVHFSTKLGVYLPPSPQCIFHRGWRDFGHFTLCFFITTGAPGKTFFHWWIHVKVSWTQKANRKPICYVKKWKNISASSQKKSRLFRGKIHMASIKVKVGTSCC